MFRWLFLVLLSAFSAFAGGCSSAGVDLLAERGQWVKLQDLLQTSLTWTEDGAAVLSSTLEGMPALYVNPQRLSCAGTLKVELQFREPIHELGSAGIELRNALDVSSVMIIPSMEQVSMKGETFPLVSLVEEPYRYVLDLVLKNGRVVLYYGGVEVGSVPFQDAAGSFSLALVSDLAVCEFRRAEFVPDESAGSRKDALDGLCLTFDLRENSDRLNSTWADYFGTHYTVGSDVSGIAWGTIRCFAGPHVKVIPEALRKNSSERVGPFSKKTLRLDLSDLRGNRRTVASLEEALPELTEKNVDAIIPVMLKPTLEPFDKDLAYWATRVTLDALGENQKRVVWHVGNEVVSSHFDPLKIKDKVGIRKGGNWDQFFGYDLEWKLNYYLNDFLAPAIEAIELAYQNKYKDPACGRVALGSMNPYNPENYRFLTTVMDSSFKSEQAPALDGQLVSDHIDYMTVHYMCANDLRMGQVQELADRYLKTGKVKGIWVTEEHGGRGLGQVTIIERGLRFLSYVARNGFSSEQARLCWWGEEGARPGGSGRQATRTLGEFFSGGPLFYAEQKVAGGTVYFLSNGEGADLSRIMVAFVPAEGALLSIDSLSMNLPAGCVPAGWDIKAVQYHCLTLEEPVPVTCSGSKGRLQLKVQHQVMEPFVIFLKR